MTAKQLGPYILGELLGRGGMGSVYRGRHVETGEEAAIKVLLSGVHHEEHLRDRFSLEIDTLKKLRHPHIVQLYGYGEQDGVMFYAMELVEGESLESELQNGRRFDWREVARFGVAICKALKHAHDRGIIHRDLKPANLLLCDAKPNGGSEAGAAPLDLAGGEDLDAAVDETIKLSDFGIAKLFGASQLTNQGGVIGTADYMAPEQADGRPVSPRCDLFSLGSVMYALLAGRPPFYSKSLPEVIHQVRFGEPPPLRRLAPDAPVELERIIQELMAKDPQERIPTALSAAHRLEAMLKALSRPQAWPEEKEGSILTGNADSDADFVLADPHAQSSPPAAASGDADRKISLSETIVAEDDVAARKPSAPREATLRADADFTPRPREVQPAAALATVVPAKAAAQYTPVDKSALGRDDSLSDDRSLPAWMLLAALFAVLLILAAGVWYARRPPSADRLHERIAAAAEEESTLLAAEPDVLQFLERYGDDERAGEVERLREEIELIRLQRRFELRARLRGHSEQQSTLEGLYLDAMQRAERQPDRALERLEATIALFAAADLSEDDRRCLELARRQAARLRQEVARSISQQAEVLMERLDTAAALAADNPEEAANICEAIIVLYGEKPWAGEIVSLAETLLVAIELGRE